MARSRIWSPCTSTKRRYAEIRSITGGGATANAMRNPGASTLDSVPKYTTTPCRSSWASGRTGALAYGSSWS